MSFGAVAPEAAGTVVAEVLSRASSGEGLVERHPAAETRPSGGLATGANMIDSPTRRLGVEIDVAGGGRGKLVVAVPKKERK